MTTVRKYLCLTMSAGATNPIQINRRVIDTFLSIPFSLEYRTTLAITIHFTHRFCASRNPQLQWHPFKSHPRTAPVIWLASCIGQFTQCHHCLVSFLTHTSKDKLHAVRS